MAIPPAAVLDDETFWKIRRHLTEGPYGVSLGFALLESHAATAADMKAVLAFGLDRAVAAVADGWLQRDTLALSEYERYHRLVVAPRFLAEREAHRAAGRSFLDLVEIPAGKFEMGSAETVASLAAEGLIDLDERYYNERPPSWESMVRGEQPMHRVRIRRPYLLGKTQVTQGQWWSVMGTLPWQGKDYVQEGADVAATYVSWVDAVEFCARLTKLEQSSGKLGSNQRYRLPTEAEWEYACRAGTKTRFSFGNDVGRLEDFAWYGCKKGIWTAREVGQKNPNPWGLHDMHGNVWECCSDWRDDGYYKKSPAGDPEGPAAGSFRVVRGGSWQDDAFCCRSACRGSVYPTDRDNDSGFRVVMSLE